MPVTPVPVPQLPCDVPLLSFLLFPSASDLRQKLVKFLQPTAARARSVAVSARSPDRVSRSASKFAVVFASSNSISGGQPDVDREVDQK